MAIITLTVTTGIQTEYLTGTARSNHGNVVMEAYAFALQVTIESHKLHTTHSQTNTQTHIHSDT